MRLIYRPDATLYDKASDINNSFITLSFNEKLIFLVQSDTDRYFQRGISPLCNHCPPLCPAGCTHLTFWKPELPVSHYHVPILQHLLGVISVSLWSVSVCIYVLVNCTDETVRCQLKCYFICQSIYMYVKYVCYNKSFFLWTPLCWFLILFWGVLVTDNTFDHH